MDYQSDFAPAMKRLVALFPQRPITPDTIAAYWEILHDMDADLFRASVARCIDRCEWFPTIKHIREAYEDIAMASIADPLEAMRRFPHRIKNPMTRAIITANLEDIHADPRHLRPQDAGPFQLADNPRRLGAGTPEA